MKIDCHVHGQKFMRRDRYRGMVMLYVEKGFNGIVITDHCKCKNFEDEEFSRSFSDSYWKISTVGEELGLYVFFGLELSMDGCDYLIYPTTIDFHLMLYKEMQFRDVKQAVLNNDGLIFQAHPLRFKRGRFCHKIDPRVDGYEVKNGHPKFDNHNLEVGRVAAALEGKLTIAGSDAHRMNHIGLAGIETMGDVREEEELVKKLERGVKIV